MNEKIYVGKDLKRRDFLKFGAVSVAGLTLPRLLASRVFAQPSAAAKAAEEAAASSAAQGAPKTKAVIQVWLNGGPCHIDTFDPKPEASRDIIGPYIKPVATNVDGIVLSDKFGMLAKCADKYSILRGINHNVFAHETATYLMQTGIPVGGELVYPSIGAVITYKRGINKDAKVPPFVSVMSPLGRFEESGFLGAQGKSFSAAGVVTSKDFNFDSNPAAAQNAQAKAAADAAFKKISDRRTLLGALDTVNASMDSEFGKMDAFRQQAYSVILGDGKEAFDLSKEPSAVRERYGKNSMAQQLLLARRLVEAGATYVIVNWGGWDTHKKHFEAMEKLLPPLDQALSALIEDLSQRGMLDSTLVMCGGEFSRTPRIMYNPPWFGGRNHYGDAGSWIVAGGGFVGGRLVGATDKNGFKVVERPIYPWDLSASVYKLAGVDINEKLPHPLGCAAYISPPEIKLKPSGGLLTEIMKA